MPINTGATVAEISQDDFHQVDKLVTGLAYAIHNEFGRILDESHYQLELAARCRAAGIRVDREFKITVSLDNFSRDYFADFLINSSVIVETKAKAALVESDEGQTLNYLFLCGLHHGTLLNFGADRVQHKFVSTTLTQGRRRQCRVVAAAFHSLTKSCATLVECMNKLLVEWGGYLDPLLYRDALAHFLFLPKQPVEVFSGSLSLGHKEFYMLENDIAMIVSAATRRPETAFHHLQRFLQHTQLRAIQAINLNHATIEIRTILRK